MPDTPYTPAPGSLAADVVAYLRRHGEVAELSQQQIADLFPPAKFASVPGCLLTPMQHQLLSRVRNAAGVLVYRRGPKFDGNPAGAAAAPPALPGTPAPASNATAAAAAAKKGKPITRLPDIDLQQLPIIPNLPIPAPQSRRGQSRYDALFDRLTEPGNGTFMPRAYLGAVKQAATKYSKRTGRRVQAYATPEQPDKCVVLRLADKASTPATHQKGTAA